MSFYVNSIIEPHKRELSALCERYRVSKLYVFGSIVTDTFNVESSDIDFLFGASLTNSNYFIDIFSALSFR
jgi:predicted nucleotidyltransferase